MKQIACIILICVFLFNMVACQTIQPAAPTPIPDEINDLSDNDADRNSDIYDLEFSDLAGLVFWFGSGAGAWNTTVEIQPDGTFNGYYHDSNMGDNGPDYLQGTRYECYFSGTFTSLLKIGDYEYSLKCEELVIEKPAGQEEIIDDVKVITSEPYGFDDADEFLLYLPGKKLNELPEMYLAWVNIDPKRADPESDEALTFYGLYNVEGEQGFRTLKEQ